MNTSLDSSLVICADEVSGVLEQLVSATNRGNFWNCETPSRQTSKYSSYKIYLKFYTWVMSAWEYWQLVPAIAGGPLLCEK